MCAAFGCVSQYLFWKMPVVADDPPTEMSSVPQSQTPAPAATQPHPLHPRQSLRSPLVDYTVSAVGGGGRVPPASPTTVEEARKAALAANYKYDMAIGALDGAMFDRFRASQKVEQLTESLANCGDATSEQLEIAKSVLSVADFELENANVNVAEAKAELDSANNLKIQFEYAVQSATDAESASPLTPVASAAIIPLVAAAPSAADTDDV
jgi:hypothetical protein